MSKKGRARNKARRALRGQASPQIFDADARALLATFEALDADPSVTGDDLTPDTWRWAAYGMARRNLLAGYENHNHPIDLGGPQVPPASIVTAFEAYQRRHRPPNTATLLSSPQEWQSALEHEDRTALVRHYLRRPRDLINMLDDADMKTWIEEFTKALEDLPLDAFAIVASYLTGMHYPALFVIGSEVFPPYGTAKMLHERMRTDAFGPSTNPTGDT